jgi:hypothetical protein
MESRTLKVVGRLSLVLVIVGAWLAISRAIAVYGVNSGMIFVDPPGNSWGYGDKPPHASFLSVHVDSFDWMMVHFVGLMILVVMLIVIAGLIALSYWIVNGPSKYVDPCQNPKCPCARHKKERQDAAAMNTALIAGATAAVTATIIS